MFIEMSMVLLQHDNARPHTSLKTPEVISFFGWTTISHPPYSPDLAGKRQFGGINLAGDNSTGQICRQANSSSNQFGGKINKNNLPFVTLHS